MLKNLRLKAVYRTESDNILSDFYIPSLKISVNYDRAVGFFSASTLSYAAQGLTAFLKNDGQMRLIIGAEVSEDEHNAIISGYLQREELNKNFSELALKTIADVNDELFFNRLTALSWLIASGRLEIKVAFKQMGMYHEKIGIFTDAIGDKVVFQGSANESRNALLPDFNFESINVFPSWKRELADHSQPYIDGFEKLWEDKSKNTIVVSFPEAVKHKLINIAKNSPPPSPKIELSLWEKLISNKSGCDEFKVDLEPTLPDVIGSREFNLMDHQRAALSGWKANDFQGVMALATGAGKTITAIYGAVKLYQAIGKLFLIVAVPYQNLADQWVDVLKLFKIAPVRCYGCFDSWNNILSKKLSHFQLGSLKFVAIVVVNRTLSSGNFQQYLNQIPGENLLFVGDECHNHASALLSSSLPEQAQMRLGLSATPEHYLDHAATLRITGYYGNVLRERYTLEDALRDSVLTPYNYHVIIIELTAEESEQYYDLSKKIGQLVARNNNNKSSHSDNQQLQTLLFQRARIIGNAENKLLALSEVLGKVKKTKFSIFYCGDGSVETDEIESEPVRQINGVSKILQENGWSNSHFTARENRNLRHSILNHFRLGHIDALVAIRCLDEGIDIPACQTAFILASSRNPKQFIQRRGRILRRSPGKEYSEIYDFVVNINLKGEEFGDYDRNLIKAELERVAEFARLALNRADTIRTLRPILDKYDLLHLIA